MTLAVSAKGATWTYVQQVTTANSHSVKLGVEVSFLMYYSMVRLVYMFDGRVGSPRGRQNDLLAQDIGPPCQFDDLVMKQAQVSSIISSTRGGFEDLGSRALGVLNIGDAIMSVVKVSMISPSVYFDRIHALYRTYILSRVSSSRRFRYR